MPSGFEWDIRKAKRNFKVHGVSFEEALTVFRDILSATVPDQANSDEEERWITMGMSDEERVLLVWHTTRGDNIRLIGARLPEPHERRKYEESK